MPRVNFDDPTLWDGGPNSLYRSTQGGQTFGYSREAMQDYLGNDVEKLIAAMVSKGLVAGQRIVFIGSAFGWVGEKFATAGYGPGTLNNADGKLLGVDISTWVQGNKAAQKHVNADIINAPVTTAAGRNNIRRAFVGSTQTVVHWVVSEDVLPALNDAEVGPLCTGMRALATVGVVHWLTTGTRVYNNPSVWAGDARLNWKTLQDWKTLVTPDWVVERFTGAIL